jgi:hypothetical protein
MSRWWLLGAAALVLAGCGEKVQTLSASGERKADTPAWETKDKRFLAPGWSPGDQNSWNAQLVHRAQGQNDFATRK